MRTQSFLLIALLLGACSGQGGKVAPGSRGPEMVGVVSPSGMKVPARAVSAEPNNGYWSCNTGHYEHKARCTLTGPLPWEKTRTKVRQER